MTNPEWLAARTPRTLWIELTSKCPFDCIFCSRRLRRAAGTHLPFELYSALLQSLVDPRKFVLNYSGESTVYPDLIPAIRQARASGAFVELVYVLASAPESLLKPLSQSGLNRLTVSVHATDPEMFATIYRYSCFTTLRSRLERFVESCRSVPEPPAVDLAFVAMHANLGQLQSVAALAPELDLHDIMIFPVMRRDNIPVLFTKELNAGGMHRAEFEESLRTTVDGARQMHPQVRFTVCNASCVPGGGSLGEVPVPYPWELPTGALIHSCEQNPWETTHILSNGDVVACEVLDKYPLGNLVEQSITEIWNGEPYRQFRERYRRGQVPECRKCPWKRAYRPHALESEIIAERGLNAQLLFGWHEPTGEAHIWSSQQAAAVLAPRPGPSILHLSGMLPPGITGSPNHLDIRLNGSEIGRVTNPWEEIMPFGLDFPAGERCQQPWLLEFRTSQIYRPSERGVGTDQRDLGFALVLAVSKEADVHERTVAHRAALDPLLSFVRAADRWGWRLRRRLRRSPIDPSDCDWKPGLSILIPEWDNPEELAACLDGVREAIRFWTEPIDIIVLVNGSPESSYQDLRRANPAVRWRFYPRPLGFAGAVVAGLRLVRHDWVYLLNSDAVLDPGALLPVTSLRSGGVFSIASQIVLKDSSRFRDETNWSTLLVESDLAIIHDWIPRSDAPVPTFYAGGGASLFRTSLLRKWIATSVYHPFYWEDVEWGWRARKLGYDCWFCPASIVHHTRRSTIARHYEPETIREVVRRNALLFQLRNFTTAGSLERAIEEIAREPASFGAHFLTPTARLQIARGRIWNHLAPFADEEVFERWNSSISNC
jgi:radical SAM protein with 4Fe4S-binding SPASM domain